MFDSLNYLFAIGTIFAFLDAWNIGANDVANSWATSVSSRSLTYLQAMVLASIMEFTGALGVGSRVSDTIRTKVVDLTLFTDNPAMLMLGMVCAVIASASWLTMATKFGFPVSTTHSIMGGIIGMGIALVGAENIQWVPKQGEGINGGVVSVFLAWIIAPGLSGFFGAILFTITKYGVMLRRDPVKWAFFAIPFYIWITATLLAMLLIWKGGSYEVNLTDPQIGGVTVATGAGFSLLCSTFFLPWLWRVVVKEDWQLRWYHIIQGPLLLKRGEVPPPPAEFHGAVQNYYEGHLTQEQLTAKRAAGRDEETRVGEATLEPKKVEDDVVNSTDSNSGHHLTPPPEQKSIVGPKPDGPLFSGPVLFWYVKWALFRGVDQDVHNLQKKQDMLAGDLEQTHARAAHYNNKAEFMYTFIQIITACTASFTHGANDVSNAIGPYATIYDIWKNESIAGSKLPVPTWILAFGGIGIVIGIWTYGYHIMANLGNRLTLQTPSRGFSMELGSAITVIIATRLKLPVSTTQCITGAIVGVGLCNGDWRALNWRMIGWIYLGWIITLPSAGIIAGCLTGFIVNAPRWGFEIQGTA